MTGLQGFKCSLCESTENVVIILNKGMRREVEKIIEITPRMVKCDDHPESFVQFYIKNVNKMVCQLCRDTKYKANIIEMISVEPNKLDSYVQSAIKKLKSQEAKVTRLKIAFEDISLNDREFTSQQFISMTRNVQAIIDNSNEEKKDGEPSYHFLSFLSNPQDNPE